MRCSSRHRTASTPRAPPRPPAITSRSANSISSAAPKYSSPMLRPPTIVTWLSAVNDLLCMRRFKREKSGRVARQAIVRLAKG